MTLNEVINKTRRKIQTTIDSGVDRNYCIGMIDGSALSLRAMFTSPESLRKIDTFSLSLKRNLL